MIKKIPAEFRIGDSIVMRGEECPGAPLQKRRNLRRLAGQLQHLRGSR